MVPCQCSCYRDCLSCTTPVVYAQDLRGLGLGCSHLGLDHSGLIIRLHGEPHNMQLSRSSDSGAVGAWIIGSAAQLLMQVVGTYQDTELCRELNITREALQDQAQIG